MVRGDGGKQERRNGRPDPDLLQQQRAQPLGALLFRVRVRENIFVDEALVGKRAGKIDKVAGIVGRGIGRGLGQAKQRRTRVREEKLKAHPADQSRLQRASEKDVTGERGELAFIEQRIPRVRPIGLRCGAPYGVGDRRILQRQVADILSAQTQRERRGEVRRRERVLVHELIGGCDIVMAGCVERVDRDRLGERFDRQPMLARSLGDKAEQIEASTMGGGARQDLLADGLGLGRPSRRERPPGRGELGAYIVSGGDAGNGLAACDGCSPFPSIHRKSRAPRSIWLDGNPGCAWRNPERVNRRRGWMSSAPNPPL